MVGDQVALFSFGEKWQLLYPGDIDGKTGLKSINESIEGARRFSQVLQGLLMLCIKLSNGPRKF